MSRSIHLPDPIPSSSIAKTIASEVRFRSTDDTRPNLHPKIKEHTFQAPCDQVGELWEGPRARIIRRRSFECARAPGLHQAELPRLQAILSSVRLQTIIRSGLGAVLDEAVSVTADADIIEAILSGIGSLEANQISYDEIMSLLGSE